MNDIEKIIKSPFYEVVRILDELKYWDLRNNAEQIQENHALPNYVDFFHTIETLLLGIQSAISYMQLSVSFIQRKNYKQYFLTLGYTDYSVYRYHYFVFCHGVATLHDLFFKLVVEVNGFNVGSKRMIQWKPLRKMLSKENEKDIIRQMEDFYAEIKEHENKRNTVSHEGFLTSPLLENYNTTYIWTNAHSKNDNENCYPQYTEGTKENKYLLGKTKKNLVDELNKQIDSSINYTLSLFDLLLPILVNRIDVEYINSYKEILENLNNENVNKYLLIE